MKTLSLKLPARLDAMLRAAMQKRRKAKSDLVREALENYLADSGRIGAVSFAALTEDLAGTIKGPRDLSSNPRHLAGFGR